MGTARRCCALLVVAGCARAGDSATPSDAPGADCSTIWYVDADEDGHGDPANGAPACSQPAKTVANNDDCDDKNRYRYPGAMEVCDGLDNDCSSASVETCPATCTPLQRPPPDTASVYLFCNGGTIWPTAKSTCASVTGFALVRINDAGENAWLRMQATTLFGDTNSIHIGANDSEVEGFWRWDGSNVHFWQGQASGMAIMGSYTAWGSGEPNNANEEDCGELRGDASWNDSGCNEVQDFVCKR